MKRLLSFRSIPSGLKTFAYFCLKKSSFSTSSSAVVLLSGGADSATTLAVAVRDGFEVHALSFDYGQRHRHELVCASRVAERFGCREHRIAQVDLRVFGGSALTSSDCDVPKDRQDRSSSIPVTYVPARNTLFLSYALAYAEVIGATDIFIGANAVDYSGYPDCRPAYFRVFERLASLGTKAGVEQGVEYKIHAPLLHLSKTEIIQLGIRLGVDFGMTHSCYDPQESGRPCGHCDACCIRQEAFHKLGFARDPALERFQ
ncbi:7-cyano-7-deazaguanine synthase [Galdieria sulphuraria]|uniref:7-cyano-7-deazaguanine synthase n=1 Tax=Galdieria sulphuraria TaxID=130081 RepID=M2WRC9_GALSU|nr:ExsB (transcription regulator related protein) isoform 2 [Galdieria sulphuraria]XP_005702866.1 ExsB (transcription regulator related protein) isoform 1 [Galdieria sulphuraria]EME26345.1 ExsB (transcription regulator related protein) isoform 2 [Galdieria sulphuraria]EME26346.1 ExsB (transcription regulator related protein) isoform 1 [Galdieria sulphuraria]GJD11515.1 7-cyano-7-deazaguanine synthase [Galdieria sulphuraria]|eukprot:XP_005702865.1 ExsB (transcription regulator related protein) isoform 2 [Galdieria sulphuraria]